MTIEEIKDSLISSYITIKLNGDSNIVPWKFPRIKIKPVIWDLHLVPVHDLLLEDAISVSEAVTPCWIVERGHTIEKASC